MVTGVLGKTGDLGHVVHGQGQGNRHMVVRRACGIDLVTIPPHLLVEKVVKEQKLNWCSKFVSHLTIA